DPAATVDQGAGKKRLHDAGDLAARVPRHQWRSMARPSACRFAAIAGTCLGSSPGGISRRKRSKAAASARAKTPPAPTMSRMPLACGNDEHVQPDNERSRPASQEKPKPAPPLEQICVASG